MATAKTDAQKVTELRKQAMDKTLPQEVRDMADKKANDIEAKSVEKATGMKLAKGGDVKAKMAAANKAKKPAGKAGVAIVIAPMKKMSKGGMAKKGKC